MFLDWFWSEITYRIFVLLLARLKRFTIIQVMETKEMYDRVISNILLCENRAVLFFCL